VLISFGAVIGRITPTQLMVMAFIEIIFFGLNNALMLWLGLADIGGTYVIHMFGAYFGLTVSRVLSAYVRVLHDHC
jgi:ammonium transporter Rh